MRKLLLAAFIAVGALSVSALPSSALPVVAPSAPAASQAEQVRWHGWRRHHDNGLHRGWYRGRHEGWRHHGGRRHDGWRHHGGRHHRWH